MSKNKRQRLTIGVIAGWQAYSHTLDTFLERVFDAIRRAAQERDCNLMLACGVGLPRGVDLGRPAWPMLLPEVDFAPVGPWNADGLIVITPLAADPGTDRFQSLADQRYPIVFLGSSEPGPSVAIDNEGGIRQAVAHLVEHDHRRIAYIAGHQHRVYGDSGHRLRAYQAAAREWDLEVDPRLIAFGAHTYAGGQHAMWQILGTGVPFTAVLASNDESAIGAMDTLREAGLRVPHDVAVIGFDDRRESGAQIPPLTTIRYSASDMGRQAVTLLIECALGHLPAIPAVEVPTRLVIRESCGCLPGRADAHRPLRVLKEDAGTVHPMTGPGDARRAAPARELDGQIARAMAEAILETHDLDPHETLRLCRRLVEAFVLSLERNNTTAFGLVVQEVLQHLLHLDLPVHPWQAAISVLREHAPALLAALPGGAASRQADDLLDQARIAIGESSWGQCLRRSILQANVANQIGWMTAQFSAAHDQEGICEALVEHLPGTGIAHAVVAAYEAEGNDPVAWSVLRTPHDLPDAQRRFSTRSFPPAGLYPTDRPFSVAVLPLSIQKERYGFAAFDTANMAPLSEIVRQLEAAIWQARVYQEAVEARHMAEEAARLKSGFLSVVSHELRVPLNLIAGLSELLLQEGEHTESGKYQVNWEDVERIHTSALHLDGLVRDVLDLVRSDLGQLRLVCEPLDLADVLNAVSVMAKQLAGAKGVTWRAEVPVNLPQVWGDRTRLRQVTLNLVNNAIKFTSQGGVVLTATAAGGRVIVTVRDTGIGIPLEEQTAIFADFHQSERTAARGYGGLGLGLAICKRLVEMHGGQIGAWSRGDEGAGSTFYFSLPAMKRCHEPGSESTASTSQYVWLLARDTEGSTILRDHLVQRGFQVEVHSINDSTEWLSALLVTPPGAVVLDLGLAAEQGWEVIKTLKANPATEEISVLFYRLARDDDTGAVLEMDYLTKPVGAAELVEALAYEGLLSNGNGSGGPKILLVDDEPGILEMHARMLEAQWPQSRVLLARNGQEALDVIRTARPDLVLLDLMMPELDGFGVLEAMRDDEASRNIPVVVLTGQVLTEEDMARLNRGVASVLSKGVCTVAETLSHIETSLARKQKLGSETQRLVRKAMAYIHTHYAHSISLDDVASSVGLSERHLTRSFRQEMGTTLVSYLNRYRVKQAKTHLEAGDKNITEVAMEVGFSDSSYFARVFRREVGVSPSAYQRGKRS